jgi:hypothetical protein
MEIGEVEKGPSGEREFAILVDIYLDGGIVRLV